MPREWLCAQRADLACRQRGIICLGAVSWRSWLTTVTRTGRLHWERAGGKTTGNDSCPAFAAQSGRYCIDKNGPREEEMLKLYLARGRDHAGGDKFAATRGANSTA